MPYSKSCSSGPPRHPASIYCSFCPWLNLYPGDVYIKYYPGIYKTVTYSQT